MVAVLLAGTACAVADDAFRVVARGGDDLGRGATYWDEVTGVARNSDNVDDLARQADDVARQAEATDADRRLIEATAAMTWDVTCDLASGQAPTDGEALALYVAQNAVNFGLEFGNQEDAQVFADIVWAMVDAPDEQQRAAEACQRVPDAGF
jgi:hypothetical protein